MSYSAKEVFLTVQGEGGQAGRPAVFLRFAGCNLWNGLERDRASAVCTFCDTDFVGTDGDGGGDDAFSWVGSSAFSGTAGELRAYSQSGSHYLAGDVDGDGVADFMIQTNLPIITSDVIL